MAVTEDIHSSVRSLLVKYNLVPLPSEFPSADHIFPNEALNLYSGTRLFEYQYVLSANLNDIYIYIYICNSRS